MSSDQFTAWVAAADSAMVAVTAANADALDACLVGFHSQASIHPARYVVWLSAANRTTAIALHAAVLGVHLMTPDDLALARHLGSVTQDDDPTKLAGVRTRRDASGAVLLEDCRSWFVGRIVGRFDGGDHHGFLLEPISASCDRMRRLLRLHDVSDLEAGHPAD